MRIPFYDSYSRCRCTIVSHCHKLVIQSVLSLRMPSRTMCSKYMVESKTKMTVVLSFFAVDIIIGAEVRLHHIATIR